MPPYLVLLRAGFCLPPVLPPARCALTAPFHPYSPSPLRAPAERYVFCATVLRVAPTGRYPAHCPAEFGLSSRRSPEGAGGRSSGSLRGTILSGAGRAGRAGRASRVGAGGTGKERAFPACPIRSTCPAIRPSPE